MIVFESVTLVPDVLDAPPPMLSPSTLNPTLTLVVSSCDTVVVPPSVTEIGSVAPPQLVTRYGQHHAKKKK